MAEEQEIFLPTAKEDEQAVLTCLLFENSLIETARAYLKAGDFFSRSHQLIYGAMLGLWDREGVITPVLIGDELKRDGRLEEVGGLAYVADFWSGHVPFTLPETLMSYVRRVKEAALQRQIVHFSGLLQAQASDREPVLQMITAAEREIESLRSQANLKESGSIADDVDAVITELERIEATGGISGLRTGFPDLDRIVHGYQKGLLYILAGGSGDGKTTIALQSVLRITRDRRGGEPVIGIVSLEMPRNKIVQRLLQLASCVPDQLMMGGKMQPDDWRAVKGGAAELSALRVKVADPDRSLLDEVTAHTMDLIRTFGQVDLLIVDFIQMLRSDEAGFDKLNRANQLDRIAYGLKALALKHDFPLIALSQINRDAARRTERDLNDLRDSGGITQAADVVMMLTCLDAEAKKTADLVDYDLAVVKNRYGRVGIAPLQFSNSVGAFGERMAAVGAYS